MIKDFYQLTKPGIVYGNLMTAIAGFLFATTGIPDVKLFFAMIAGLGFSIAASCVANNVIDRDIDAKMARTKDRALPAHRIGKSTALLYAGVLMATGLALLYFFTNKYALLITLFGVIVYLAFYTPAKRITPYSTIIGAFAGAVPPVVGYAAATNRLDTTALLLFLALMCWQMTHFFAIAIFRKDDYQAAGIPVMPIYLGNDKTKILMIIYAALFTASIFTLALVDGLGPLFSIPLGAASLVWVLMGILGFKKLDTIRWARTMFFYSLALLLLFSLLLAIS